MLVLMRHGETANNAEGKLTSRTDVGLSERGHAQARHAASVCSTKFMRIVSSPLRRAQETAHAFAKHTFAQHEVSKPSVVPQYPIQTDPLLIEFDFGCFEGISGKDLLVSGHKDMYETWLRGDHVDHGGESWKDLRHRCENILQTYGPRPHEDPTLLVTHGYVIRAIMALVLNSPVSAVQSMRIDNTRFLVLSHERGNVRVVGFNVCDIPTL